MPLVPFDSLPADARVWVFAATDPVTGSRVDDLLSEVDDYLHQWKAHAQPLTCAREWRDDRFLAVGVDQSTAGASGCSIDGLFRILQRLQSSLGTSLVGGGRVFYRDQSGEVRRVDRATFARLGASGDVNQETRVFDTSVVTAEAYRRTFEGPARASWHSELVKS